MENIEIVSKIKNCKTIEELKTLGKEIGYELTDEEAKFYFDKLTKSGELTDDELNSVSGGGCTKWRKGKAYSGNPPHYLIVTRLNSCKLWEQRSPGKAFGFCMECKHLLRNFSMTKYCTKRKWNDDPLNK